MGYWAIHTASAHEKEVAKYAGPQRHQTGPWFLVSTHSAGSWCVVANVASEMLITILADAAPPLPEKVRMLNRTAAYDVVVFLNVVPPLALMVSIYVA